MEEIMYQLLKSLSNRELFQRQLPVLLSSFVIAELFYKFHSFTLETAAFLATWFVLDWMAGQVTRILARNVHDGSE
jgi:hypothetical protein